jgi:subtilisin
MFSQDLFFPSDETRDWGDAAIGIDQSTEIYDGQGTTVAILDTGVDRFHPDLSIHRGANFVEDESSNDFRDPYGHGTFVAGIMGCLRNQIGLIGVCPKTRIIVARVGRFNETTRLFENDLAAAVLNAMTWVMNQGANVVNLSLEFQELSSALLERLEACFRSAVGRGVVLIAATGNGKKPEASYPASSEFVVGVGAFGDKTLGNIPNVRAWDSSGRFYIPWFSNYGRGLDVIGPGVRVPSTLSGGNGSYAWGNGTSVAAPYVTGLCALLLQADQSRRMPSESYTRRISDAIRMSALPISGISQHYQGFGVVNLKKALAVLGYQA